MLLFENFRWDAKTLVRWEFDPPLVKKSLHRLLLKAEVLPFLAPPFFPSFHFLPSWQLFVPCSLYPQKNPKDKKIPGGYSSTRDFQERHHGQYPACAGPCPVRRGYLPLISPKRVHRACAKAGPRARLRPPPASRHKPSLSCCKGHGAADRAGPAWK